VVTLTLPNEAVFFYFGKLAIQQTLSPLHNWFYIDFLGAKVEFLTILFSSLALRGHAAPATTGRAHALATRGVPAIIRLFGRKSESA
ncbi:hypothetical protein, partial [Thermobacillus sp.]|uniref:hypothetical protein n=1 Tax=Thermobacillus sp. TaxID=2108467 RepID=UPI00257FE83B